MILLLPFQDEQFDFIMNQHESYSASEVNRILSPNGIFLTQQVGGLDCAELNEQFNAPLNNEFASWSLETACSKLKENGFTILEAKEEFPFQRFYDIGAIVYYLKAIPWQILILLSKGIMRNYIVYIKSSYKRIF